MFRCSISEPQRGKENGNRSEQYAEQGYDRFTTSRLFLSIMATQQNFRFDKALFQYLSDLSDNNNREWFQNNKSRYETCVVQPSLQFISAMEKTLARNFPCFPPVCKRVGGSLIRIYRDTRFSNDKTPYKTNVGIHFKHQFGRDVHAPGLYLHLEPTECFIGVGMWMPDADSLRQIRQAIVEDSQHWMRVKKDRKFTARFAFDGNRLRSAPRGFEKDHPLIEDIKCRSFAAISRVSKGQLCSSSCLELIGATFKDGKPLMRFLCEALQLPF